MSDPASETNKKCVSEFNLILIKQELINSTHSFFLFDFDAKRNKRIGGAEEKKKNTIPAESLLKDQIGEGRKVAFALAEKDPTPAPTAEPYPHL